MTLHGNLGGTAHDPDFLRCLDEPLFMQQMFDGDEFIRRFHAAARAAAHLVDGGHDGMIQLGIMADGEVDPCPVFQQFRQAFLQFIDGKCLVGPMIFKGAFKAGMAACPDGLFRIIGSAKQDVFTLLAAGCHDRHGLRFMEAGQVMKVAVLPVGVFDVTIANARRRAGQNGHAMLFHLPHEAFAALLEVAWFQDHR